MSSRSLPLLFSVLLLVSGCVSVGGPSRRGEEEMRVYLAPEDSLPGTVLEKINGTRHSLLLAAAEDLPPGIIDSVIRAQERGVVVRILLPPRTETWEAEYQRMVDAEVPTRIARTSRLSTSFLLLDGETVVLGTFYPQGDSRLDLEGVLVVFRSPALALRFERRFWRSWSEGRRIDFEGPQKA
jgi:phosphatidylserine/phosphatidylglycerophosphate/cardiolipin synthase-like enzyme